MEILNMHILPPSNTIAKNLGSIYDCTSVEGFFTIALLNVSKRGNYLNIHQWETDCRIHPLLEKCKIFNKNVRELQALIGNDF